LLIGDFQKASCRSTTALFCPIKTKQGKQLRLVWGKKASLVPRSIALLFDVADIQSSVAFVLVETRHRVRWHQTLSRLDVIP